MRLFDFALSFIPLAVFSVILVGCGNGNSQSPSNNIQHQLFLSGFQVPNQAIEGVDFNVDGQLNVGNTQLSSFLITSSSVQPKAVNTPTADYQISALRFISANAGGNAPVFNDKSGDCAVGVAPPCKLSANVKTTAPINGTLLIQAKNITNHNVISLKAPINIILKPQSQLPTLLTPSNTPTFAPNTQVRFTATNHSDQVIYGLTLNMSALATAGINSGAAILSHIVPGSVIGGRASMNHNNQLIKILMSSGAFLPGQSHTFAFTLDNHVTSALMASYAALNKTANEQNHLIQFSADNANLIAMPIAIDSTGLIQVFNSDQVAITSGSLAAKYGQLTLTLKNIASSPVVFSSGTPSLNLTSGNLITSSGVSITSSGCGTLQPQQSCMVLIHSAGTNLSSGSATGGIGLTLSTIHGPVESHQALQLHVIPNNVLVLFPSTATGYGNLGSWGASPNSAIWGVNSGATIQSQFDTSGAAAGDKVCQLEAEHLDYSAPQDFRAILWVNNANWKTRIAQTPSAWSTHTKVLSPTGVTVKPAGINASAKWNNLTYWSGTNDPDSGLQRANTIFWTGGIFNTYNINCDNWRVAENETNPIKIDALIGYSRIPGYQMSSMETYHCNNIKRQHHLYCTGPAQKA